MDLVPYVIVAQDYFHTHPAMDAAAGMFLGIIGTHPGQCADLAFAIVTKTPFKPAVVRAWPKVKAWLDAAEERFDLDVAEAAKTAPVVLPVAPTAPVAADQTPR